MAQGMTRSELEDVVGQTWDTNQFQRDFDISQVAFAGEFVTNAAANVDLDNGFPAGTVVSLEFGRFYVDDNRTDTVRLYYHPVQQSGGWR